METLPIQEYSQRIPEEIRRAVNGLNNETRAAIVAYLSEVGEAPFTRLEKELAIGKPALAAHLKILTQSGLIAHFYKHEFPNDQYSYYGLSDFGKGFLRNLINTLRPQTDVYRRVRLTLSLIHI